MSSLSSIHPHTDEKEEEIAYIVIDLQYNLMYFTKLCIFLETQNRSVRFIKEIR